jgi:hypothetical protein
MILFLDFDGVLHPNEVYMQGRQGQQRIVLRCDGHNLFEHAEWLAGELSTPAYDHVRIVLSTSWVWALGFARARKYLPASLQAKIKSATWHSYRNKYEWNAMTRFQQISQYVRRHNLRHWVAVDDNDIGWPELHRDNLVHTNEWGGLGDDAAKNELLRKLLLP